LRLGRPLDDGGRATARDLRARPAMSWQPMQRPTIALAYALNLGVRARRAVIGHKRHEGTAERIIRACLEDCWDGTHYRASPGHFRQFWTRDASFSAPSLARLSPEYRRRSIRTFDWAIRTWKKRRTHVTTTIHFFDTPVDVFDYGVDCLPLLLAAMRRIGAEQLLAKHRRWLEAEVRYFAEFVVDPKTALVRPDRKYSAHRDTVVNRCNAFGNSMVALLAMTLADLGWDVPEPMRPLADAPQSILLEHFWDTRGFFVDSIGDETPSGEGNIWPFWTGVVTDPDVLTAALTTLEERGFADPYPLKYEPSRRPEIEPLFVRTFMPDYQGATVWTSLGAMYMQLLRTIDPSQTRTEMDRYRTWIERDGTFWEVIDDMTGRPYSSSPLTHSDEAMLWSAIFLDLLEHFDEPPALMREPVPTPADAAAGAESGQESASPAA
jgi:hypothetical protein